MLISQSAAGASGQSVPQAATHPANRLQASGELNSPLLYFRVLPIDWVSVGTVVTILCHQGSAMRRAPWEKQAEETTSLTFELNLQ